MIDVSIIIVSFNTLSFIKKCIDAVIDSNFKNLTYEIIVVDNASSDNSVKVLKKQFPNIAVIANKENLGFAKANNIGVKKAKGKFLLFLNPDIEVQNNTIGEIYKFTTEYKDAGAATCKIILPNGNIDDASHRGFPTPWNSLSYFSGLSRVFSKSKIFSGYSMTYLDLSKTHEIDVCAGAFMMVPRKAGDEIGWWDEDYFFYGEDIEFCLRLKEKGYKVYYVPRVFALHHKGVSGGIKKVSRNVTTASYDTRIRATNERFNAMRIFYRKHYEEKYPKPLTWLVYAGINLKHKIVLAGVKKYENRN